MAFTQILEKQVFGESLVFTDAYYQIVSVSGNKNQINAHLVVYKDDNKQIQLDEMFLTFTPNVGEGSTNFIEQAYLHAKTLPNFADAVDC